MRSITAEGKLLNILKKKDSRLHKSIKPVRTSSEIDKLDEKRHESDLFGLIGIFLIIGSIGLFCLLAYKYCIFKAKGTFPQILGSKVDLESKGLNADILANKEPFSYYERTISQRDIFQAPWEKEKEKILGQVEAVLDISRKTKLVGVLLDDDPTAIIEDTDKHKTLFMSIGDKIDGAILEEINEGKVIFLQNNNRIEITP